MSKENHDFIIKSLIEAQKSLSDLIKSNQNIEKIIKASDLISSTFINKSTVYSCGNGGSMSDSMHFCAELSGRYRKDRSPLAAISISDPAYLTCAGNDYGYEGIFSRFLEANGKKDDLLLAISTSGKSSNVVLAAEYAVQNGIKVVSLTGKEDSILKKYSDINICTPCGIYPDRVQEIHIKVLHILVELIERKLFPKNYI